MFKRYCKLIFTTLVIALAFTAFSFPAFADPLTAAMISSGMASGFGFTGFTGMTPSDISSSLNVGYTDPVPWDSISHKSATVTDIDNNTVSIVLSNSITTAGERRLEQLNAIYGLQAGSFHAVGVYPAYNGYVFCNHSSGNSYFGNSIGSFVTDTHTYYVSNDCYVVATKTGSSSYKTVATLGQVTTGAYSSNYSSSNYNGSPIRFRIQNYSVSNPPSTYVFQYQILRQDNNTWYNFSNDINVSSGTITLTSVEPIVSRSSESEILDPYGKENKIVFPKSFLNDISYTSGEEITSDSVIQQILDAFLEAVEQGQIASSIYDDIEPGPTLPPPTPTPSTDTVSDTLWTDYTDYFSEQFGDIFDDLHDFKESFGDWVEDVASGWTEVFGDIYDDLHGFKESFGDWLDDVASGWTEVFGDIYSTLSGTISSTLSTIASTVQSLVSTIENADFEFVDAFWKNFLTPFTNLFNTIKSHLSIWHYVVEWLASISSVFTFYRGVFSGAGSGYLLPIYACFAGTVVIAVYKRFGK